MLQRCGCAEPAAGTACGCNVHGYPDAEDGYPIQVASQKGYTEIVKMLIEKGAKVDTFHNYAIKQAHENQYYDIVCLLEQHGAKLD